MRLTFLSTSSLDDPSPRGRWLPIAQELSKQGYDVSLVLLHHWYDQLPRSQRIQQHSEVMVYYASQMHVYGPVGQRRYPSSLELVRLALQASIQFANIALRLKSDAVHVCKPQPMNGLAGMLAARALGCPLYVDCDDYEAGGNRFGSAWQQWVVRFWEDTLPRHAVGVTTNTRFLQQRYLSLGVPPSRVAYVPNGITSSRLQPPSQRQVDGLRSALELGEYPIVAYVGTLSQTSHNVGLLLDAFARVAQQAPQTRLLLVGDGEDKAILQQQAQNLGIASQAIFVGAVPFSQVPIYLALATCTVDPVSDDAVASARSPLKIVESLASGVPVVTGNVGDRAEMLGNQAGVLVTPGSAESLAAGIRTIVQNPQQQQQMANGARKRAEAYCWQHLVAEWEKLYHL